jgi:hypothetical protein
MKAECTWGEGPDVVLSLEDTPLVLGEHPDFDRNRFLYGVITKGEIDLTADQAHKLGIQLIDACKRIKELEDNIPEVLDE